ncbi:MAG: hypothetical protein J5836_03605 [Clostridia bacterium]|nr:hypothetical protein [Clostridia bacterium]
MFTSVVVKRTANADKIITGLKGRGVLVGATVLDLDGNAAKSCARINAQVVFLEAESGFSALVEITTRLGWKKFRIFSFDMTDGGSSAKFYICYGENCFNIFPNSIFNQDFSLEKFESYI